MTQTPQNTRYDVVIIGGAMLGSSAAWWLSRNPDFDGTILVVERDLTYEFTSTTATNSCIRQQFSTEVNIRISQFGADFIHNFQEYMDDAEAPKLTIQSYGYMYLADTPAFADTLKEALAVQEACGAGTQFWTRDQIAEAYPFYHLDDIVGANHNLVNEGYFDGGTIFDWWRKKARAQGAEYIANEVVDITRAPSGDRIDSVTLKSGEVISCGTVINASGPRANRTAGMAGLSVPVEPRKRYTYIFAAENPLDRDLPLTIDASGVHMRTDGQYYLAGCPPDDDPAVDFDDMIEDHSLWENKVWPAIATRIPQFEAIKLMNSWVGHYAFNTLDQNAVIGPHTEVSNFMFLNGFSGHGFQQSPAMGRGISELVTYGDFRTLDLGAFGYGRVAQNRPIVEKAVI